MTTQQVSPMTTEQISRQLVDLCRKGDFEIAQKNLFARDAISIEPFATPEFEKETKGLAAIEEKGRKFQSMVEKIYSLKVSDPLVAGNSFAVTMEFDSKMKGHDREVMSELCVYEVKDGKIISEQFFV
jgi:SnoaL-like domain